MQETRSSKTTCVQKLLQRPIIGVDFNFVINNEVIDLVEKWRQQGESNFITITNPHSVMLCRRDQEMREATRSAALTLPDGVGIIVSALMLGYGRKHRATGPDLMLKLCEQGRSLGHRHFFYGGGPGIADQLAEEMARKFPGLQIAGTYCPPFQKKVQREDPMVIEKINATRPDIIWAGLGAPKQEKWMHLHQGHFEASTMIGVGAAFDFHSGNIPWSPKWVRKIGMEWAYRLAENPKRMWRRNLDSPLFLGHVMLQRIGMEMQRLRRSNKAEVLQETQPDSETPEEPHEPSQRVSVIPPPDSSLRYQEVKS